MGSGHSHGSGGHGHGHGSERAIAIAALLTGGFMLAEVAGGLISGSLALLADAGHMLTDFASLVLAWLAFRFARRPATWRQTYVMLWVAVAGLIVNILAFWVLTRGEGENLNVRAAALHVAGDLLGSVAAIVAALVILWTGWTPIDPLLSVLVVFIILRSAWKVVAESGHMLLEGAPSGFDAREVAADLGQWVPGVVRIHHLHAWSITQERPIVTLEAQVSPGTDHDAARRAIKSRLSEHFGVGHATVEVQEAKAPAELAERRTVTAEVAP